MNTREMQNYIVVGVSNGIDVASLDIDYVLAGVLKCLDQFEVQS